MVFSTSIKDLNDAADTTSSRPVMFKFGRKELLNREFHSLVECTFVF